MSLEKEPKSQEQQPKPGQSISLAELSRQYLSGKVGLEEYLVLERQMTPRFGEAAIATLAIEEEIRSSRQATINQQKPPPKGSDSESRENIPKLNKDGNENKK